MLNLGRNKPFLYNRVGNGSFAKKSVRFLTEKVVIVGGVRIPFSKASTKYYNLDLHKITSETNRALWKKFKLDNNFVEYGIYGNAIQNLLASNVGFEAISGVRNETALPCHTINAACISSLLAATSAADLISSKTFGAVIAGGIEYMSDHPMKLDRFYSARRFSNVINNSFFFRHRIHKATKYNPFPQIVDYLTGRSMIDECEIMCRRMGVSRHESDEYSLLSHVRASNARDNNLLTDISPLKILGYSDISSDNVIRLSTFEKLSELPSVSNIPRVDNKNIKYKSLTSNRYGRGIITAGNASKPADGGALVLISSEKKALDYGYSPKAIIKDYEISSHDPGSNFLLGTAYSVARLLHKNKLTFKDIGVWEVHEPFAGHVMAVLKCLNSPEFLKNEAKVSGDFGHLAPEDINLWGGTLAFGHPLAATGARLINMAVERLHYENKQYAIVCGCSPGSLGTAILLEHYISRT